MNHSTIVFLISAKSQVTSASSRPAANPIKVLSLRAVMPLEPTIFINDTRKRGTGRPSGIRGVPVSPKETFFIPETSMVFIAPRVVGATRSSSSAVGISMVMLFLCFSASRRRKAFVTVIRSNSFFRRYTVRRADITGAAIKKRPKMPRKILRINSGMVNIRIGRRKNQATPPAKTREK